jgi:hypothetical protein
VNDWFDCMNSRVQFDKNRLKSGFGIHFEEQKNALDNMCQAVVKMRSFKHKGLLPFQRGILIGAQALLQLFDHVHHEFGVRYLRTVCLNQDVDENFFSRLRALGITDDHPGADKICIIYKIDRHVTYPIKASN